MLQGIEEEGEEYPSLQTWCEWRIRLMISTSGTELPLAGPREHFVSDAPRKTGHGLRGKLGFPSPLLSSQLE